MRRSRAPLDPYNLLNLMEFIWSKTPAPVCFLKRPIACRTQTKHIVNSALTMVRLYFLLFPGKTQPSIHRTYAD